jgi:Co/Zn/Cd efflux system component
VTSASRAVLLDTVADAAAAAGVAAMGGIILLTGGWYWLDPAVALAIVVVVGYHALALVLKCCDASDPVPPHPGRSVPSCEAR